MNGPVAIRSAFPFISGKSSLRVYGQLAAFQLLWAYIVGEAASGYARLVAGRQWELFGNALSMLTIEQMLTIGTILFVLPAIYFAFMAPFVFIRSLFRIYVRKYEPAFEGNEKEKRSRFSGYMILAGAIIAISGINQGQSATSYLGGWIFICGIAAYFLGRAWFTSQRRPVDS
jgi:hypothetical protein